MARTIAEIKQLMTDDFITDNTIRSAYELEDGKSFEEQFSKISIESILFYIVAVAIWAMEKLFDLHKEEVDTRISRAVLASIPWYYSICRTYQHGDDLVFDEKTMQFIYPTVDENKQIIKYVAVRDYGNSVKILIAGDQNGIPTALTEIQLSSIKHYLNKMKPAGVIVNLSSHNPDLIIIRLHVQINPIVFNVSGSLISQTNVYPVEDTVNQYLRGIVYGGTFNKTKLVDAIQKVTGVIDVWVDSVYAKSSTASEYQPVISQNYTSISGAFKSENLRNTIEYVV